MRMYTEQGTVTHNRLENKEALLVTILTLGLLPTYE